MNQRCRIAYPHDFPDHPCLQCHPEIKERETRKDNFVSYVLGKSKGMVEDEEALIEEAKQLFDKENPINN